ncbi:hypothetical protein HZH66_002999 [Vespula vulgaris]|uniref:Uncharacterized protein n=1 Tax=Vespula vulgaris TaxID=7454 RepID=A0A834KM79_VESVU|nr:hypothetical protein HZH66_002999 [Vespula vulgaris]
MYQMIDEFKNWVKRCESIANYESSTLGKGLRSIFEQLDFPRIPLVSDVSSFEARSLADPRVAGGPSFLQIGFINFHEKHSDCLALRR